MSFKYTTHIKGIPENKTKQFGPLKNIDLDLDLFYGVDQFNHFVWIQVLIFY